MKRAVNVLLVAIMLVLILKANLGLELKDRAIVASLGFDNVDGRYEVTAVVFRPKGSVKDEDNGYIMLSSYGNSFMEALDSLENISVRDLFLKHNGIVILGESISRDTFTDISKLFVDTKELRLNSDFLCCHGSAREFLLSEDGEPRDPEIIEAFLNVRPELEVSLLEIIAGKNKTSLPKVTISQNQIVLSGRVNL